MLKLMKRQDIREALAANNIRVVLRGANERNSDHPGIIGPGGAVPGQPQRTSKKKASIGRTRTACPTKPSPA